MDTGNFFERHYEQLEMLAPETVFVQAKTYYGGGIFYTIVIHYDRGGQREADAHQEDSCKVPIEARDFQPTRFRIHPQRACSGWLLR